MRLFLFVTASRPTLGPNTPHIQWVPATLTPEVKRPGRKADLLTIASAQIKNAWSSTSAPPIRVHGVVLR
jgi:hypothetical protein